MQVAPAWLPSSSLDSELFSSTRAPDALYEKPLLVTDLGSMLFLLLSDSSSLRFRMYSFSSRNLQHNQKTPEDQCSALIRCRL